MLDATPLFTVKTSTASDGYVWGYRHYEARPVRSAPRGRIVCLHGIQSHAGWYDISCSHLCQKGYDVYFLDRRGSGVNIEARGDTPNYTRLILDVVEFIQQLPGPQTPGSPIPPIFLVGISWGGKTALAAEAIHPGLVQGIVLLCPGLFPQVGLPFRERLRIAMARIYSPRRYFSIPLTDAQLFTETPRWLQFLREDPLSLHRATARFLIESVRLDRLVQSRCQQVTVPILLMLAGKDRIIDNRRTRQYISACRSIDKKILEYPVAHHTLEFEPDPAIFLHDLVQWLEEHS